MPKRKKPEPTSDCVIPPVLPDEALRGRVLGQVDHEVRAIRGYMEGQAPDEVVTHLEKVKTERLLGRRYDCWDVRTDKGRWWVITEPTNLYSQEQFTSLDYTLSFHIGVTFRVFERSRLQAEDKERDRLAAAWRRWEQAAHALEHADEAEDFQSVGMKCRECLLALSRGIAEPEMIPEGREAPKAADFIGWSETIADWIAKGGSAKETRGYLKSVAKAAWQLANWLTHASNAVRPDGYLAVEATQHVLDAYGVTLMRYEADAPDRCPRCGSYRLTSDFRPELETDPPYITLCESCGWESLPDEGEEVDPD